MMSNSYALMGNISLSDEMAPERHVASAVFVGPRSFASGDEPL
jgi:hypothetical protein